MYELQYLSLKVVFTVCYGLMTLFGTFANTIAAICLWKKNKTRHSKLDSILLSLTTSDILTSVLVYPTSGWLFYWADPKEFSTDSILYRTRASFAHSLTSISSMTIIMLAAVKYIKISRFATFDIIVTTKRIKILIILSWIASIALICPYIVTGYFFVFFTIFVAISTTISLPILYFLIVRVYKQSRQRIARMRTIIPNTINQSNPPSTSNESIERTTKKLVRKVQIFIGAYIICMFPSIICMSLYASKIIEDNALYHAVLLLFYGNSCVNPVLYMLHDLEVRTMAKRLFTKPK